MKTRTPCGELVWRSNMRRCRFEDGSRYCPSTCKWYFRFYQTSKSFQECWRIWLEKFKTRFSFYEHFFSFHHKVVKKKGIINSCGKGREKKIANLQKDWGRKRRQGQGWRKTNVLWEIGYYTCSLPPSLAWTEGPWTLPANYNWNLPSPTHSLHRMAGPKGWKLQHVNTETKKDLISI